jgi:hypothetical protein
LGDKRTSNKLHSSDLIYEYTAWASTDAPNHSMVRIIPTAIAATAAQRVNSRIAPRLAAR